MKTLSNGTQTLNIAYAQSLSPDVLNKIFYNTFTPGVIEGVFEFSSTMVTISSVAFLIRPQNQSDILVRIDTTEPITITNNSSTNIYLIARYRWENPNVGAEFLFADDATIVGTDVILVGLTLNRTGNITALDYDVQERAKLKLIQTTTTFPLISQLDGYTVGHGSGYIPISDGELNEGLNAQYFDGKEITDFAVSKEATSNTFDEETGEQVLVTPTYPDWMDVDAVSLGEGITSEFVMGLKVQPQDGTTEPGKRNQIPIANGILQKDLNTNFLGGYLENGFAKSDHTHPLDDIIDGPSGYNRVLGVVGNVITGDSIGDDSIDYTKIDRLAYDVKLGYWFQPVYETGKITLTGLTESSEIPFTRTINNARVVLQRAPAVTETLAAGAEKRTARVTEITTTGFKARQMSSIIKSGSNYIKQESSDAAANQYYYFVVGEAI